MNMNIYSNAISDLFDNTEVNTQSDKTDYANLKVPGDKTDSIEDSKQKNMNETAILKSNSLEDAYDRVVEKKNGYNSDQQRGRRSGQQNGYANGQQNGAALSADMIQKLGALITPDNYSMYEELGVIPDQDDPAKTVTVSERIQIELATYCKDYQPTGMIDAQDIKNLYGDSALSYQVASELNKNNLSISEDTIKDVFNALDKAKNIQQISPETSAYLLANGKPLSIENIYMAEHSINATQSNKYQQLSDAQWKELQPQAEKVLVQSGMAVTKDSMADAKWLVEQKIPVTAENLWKLSEIRTMNDNLNQGISSEQWVEAITKNMAFGGTAVDTPADVYSSISMKSAEAVEIIQNGTEEQIQSLVLDQKDVTLLNMKHLQEDRSIEAQKDNNTRNQALDQKKQNSKNEKGQQIDFTESQQKEFIKAKRTLEETRLTMSIQASAVLIKNGINIDITPLSDLVDQLKKMEDSLTETIFSTVEIEGNPYQATVSNRELLQSSVSYMRSLSTTPAYILGTVVNQTTEYTVTELVDQGSVMEKTLKKAQDSYETLGTKPDKALGDSLRKAFSGIDQMLNEQGLEGNEENQRAVRILAYNQMEITKENIATVKEMDTQVTRLIDNMTPKTTAYLIANGINPLKTNIAQLNDQLDDIRSEIGDTEPEKFSTFLYQLDQHNDISEEDREAYIGIYRILNMVEKGDRSGIGALIKQNADLTMKNLLTAVRSRKKTGREYDIDDNIGLTEEVKLSDDNIDRQLDLLASDTFIKRSKDVLSPETIKNVLDKKDIMDMSLQEFAEYMSDQTQEESVMDQKMANQLACEEMNNVQTISEDALNMVMQDEVKPVMENILATTYILYNKSNLFKNVNKVCEDEKVTKSIEKTEDVMEAEDNDIDSLNQNLQEVVKNIKEALLSKAHIDPSEMRRVSKSADYIQKAANQNTYYVPVKMGDEETTIKLSFRNNGDERGKVEISLSLGQENPVYAQFSVKANKVQGLIISSQEMNDQFQKNQVAFETYLQKNDFDLQNISFTEDTLQWGSKNLKASKEPQEIRETKMPQKAKESEKPQKSQESNEPKKSQELNEPKKPANSRQLFTIAKQFIKYCKKTYYV